MNQNNMIDLLGTGLCPDRRRIWSQLGWVFVFAVAMGLLEGICVIYLRRLLIPVGATVEQLGPPISRWPVEVVREFCTIVMLLAVAWVAGFNWRSRLAHFFFMFGVWDILYYVALWWFGGWPSSIMEWDCLFLIPKPWYGPVLAPVLISLYFMVGCCVALAHEKWGCSLRVTLPAFGLQILAMFIWYWSFVKDSDAIKAYGYEGVHYSWWLFAAGLVCGLASLWLAGRGGDECAGTLEGN
ncbi:MAG: hypothetical protein PHV34_07550 [Verrucomicrobiae bacterium]|nr:hypothetical protein [Verrucomicrobiae bacterium]